MALTADPYVQLLLLGVLNTNLLGFLRHSDLDERPLLLFLLRLRGRLQLGLDLGDCGLVVLRRSGRHRHRRRLDAFDCFEGLALGVFDFLNEIYGRTINFFILFLLAFLQLAFLPFSFV